MHYIKKICITSVLSFLLLLTSVSFASARDENTITDWYIDNFESNILVNKDSSLLITEKITADAGNLPNKHGIFRVLPTAIKTDKGVFKTPIELVSITDFNGKPYEYQTIKDSGQGIITWKIGNPNITVRGKNYYKIVYRIQNAIRTANPDFDEFYWNLSGNFWDIEIDKFSASVVFPPEITKENTEIYYYTGYYGSKDTELATYSWTNPSTINFSSTRTIQTGEGITVSVTFPKNIFAPYQMSFLEKYAEKLEYLFFIIPLIIFIFCFVTWEKFGKDLKMKTPVPPEFGIPENITPIQMGMVLHNGRWRNNFITAAIIDLAVKKYIVIKESGQSLLGLKFKDYELTKAENYGNINSLGEIEKNLLIKIFSGRGDSVSLRELRESFYEDVDATKKMAFSDVVKNDWQVKKSANLSVLLITLSILLFFISVFASVFLSALLGLGYKLFASLILSSLILAFFGFIMPKRTQKGVDLLFKIKGFEIYMKQAENFRQQFYEKENIFDKFLPYAMIFGITDLWIKKMQKIYGQDYFKNYHPVWFVGTNIGNFDMNSFASQLNSITTHISTSTSTSSGAGGGGGSGGGGGGGGGGGW